jgi:hypothetical protein
MAEDAPVALILAGVNSQYAFLATDRFLESVGGSRLDPEHAIPTVVQCDDARSVVGFVSFAQHGQFDVRSWLREGLADAARAQPTIESMIGHFAEGAGASLARLPLSSAERRLSVVFSSMVNYSDGSVVPWLVRVSNYEERGAEPRREANADFDVLPKIPDDPANPGHLVVSCGVNGGLVSAGIGELETLVATLGPVSRVAAKCGELIRGGALAPESEGMVGTRCDAVGISRDLRTEPEGHSISAGDSRTTFEPDVDDLRSEIPIPRVGRNRPCPCGSNLKYKLCHGRKAS